MKSNSKQTSASKIVALNVSFKSCLYFEFLLSLSANAHKMLSVEKNIAIRIDKVILRLFNIPLSTQRIFKIPIENKTGTIKMADGHPNLKMLIEHFTKVATEYLEEMVLHIG